MARKSANPNPAPEPPPARKIANPNRLVLLLLCFFCCCRHTEKPALPATKKSPASAHGPDIFFVSFDMRVLLRGHHLFLNEKIVMLEKANREFCARTLVDLIVTVYFVKAFLDWISKEPLRFSGFFGTSRIAKWIGGVGETEIFQNFAPNVLLKISNNRELPPRRKKRNTLLFPHVSFHFPFKTRNP